jgi:glycosyltransferase involved in cell wall biosynthesis
VLRVLSAGFQYPPHGLGGYEVTWRSAVAAMRDDGHEVRVLAASSDETYGDEPDVHRELAFYNHDDGPPRMSTPERLRWERGNLAVLERHLREFRPDVVNWWPLGGMSVSMIERVRRAGVPAAAVICDDWLSYCFRSDMWARRFGKRGLARVAEAVSGVPTRVNLGAAASWLFNSEHMRRLALSVRDLPDTAVAHPGIESGRFAPAPELPFGWRLLYLGRIDRRKGIDTAVEALPLLPDDATLTIVGAGYESDMRELRSLVSERGLEERVRFAEVARDEVPGAYASADVLVFPVRWEEPWGLVPLEAMAMGRPVVATGTGGSAEYLRDGENCLLFERDRPEALAAALRRLAGDEGLRARLRAGGLETAARFGEESYNRAIAAAVRRAARERGGARRGDAAAVRSSPDGQ